MIQALFLDLSHDDGVKLIQRNCRASFFHNIKHADRRMQHALCPEGPASWCSYHKDKYSPLNERTDDGKDQHRLDHVNMNLFFWYDTDHR